MTDSVPTAEPSARNEELFRKLLIPEIFSEIFRYLKSKDRLNMRLCCHATEEAVARSDMHIEGSPQFIYLSSVDNQFQMHLGLKKDRTTLKLRMNSTDYDWEEFARIKERLFKRAFAKYVEIDVNFKVVPIELVARLMKGCFFDELNITISHPGNLKPNVVKYLSNLDFTTSKKVKLVLENCRPKNNTLLSLKPLRVLEMRTNDYISEEVLIEMCRRKHKNIDLPIVVTTEQTIAEIGKIVGDNPDRQRVNFGVSVETAERFVLTTGFRLIRDRRRRVPTFTNIIKLRRKNQEEEDGGWQVRKITADDGRWYGVFELSAGRVHVYAYCSISMFTFVIYNFTYSEEVQVQSDDDEDTVYF